MKQLNRLISRIDTWQQSHRPVAITYAVIKKYGEDEAGRQAALLTYYSFLSIFPLLLVLTTVTNSIIGNHPKLAKTVIDGLTNYFPMLGNQLSEHVHGLHSSGLVLIIGLLFTLYGARGVAEAFRYGIRKIWGAPTKPDGFPKSLLKSLQLIILGGLGFILASVSAGLAAAAGHGAVFRGLSVIVNIVSLFWLFVFLLNNCLPGHVKLKEILPGAATATIGLVILQAAGNYILARELKSLDALYSYFALALGLLFWLYLQAQVLYYAMEIAVVSSRRLWPRSLLTEPAKPHSTG